MGFSVFFCWSMVIHSEQGRIQESEWQEEANGTVELAAGGEGGGGGFESCLPGISFPHHA